MSPRRSRRSMLAGLGAVVGLGAVAAGQEDGDDFDPEIDFGSDALTVYVEDDVDEVTLHTSDGESFTFDGGGRYYGYSRAASPGIEGWHGVVERCTVSNGTETVEADNPYERPDLEVTCSSVHTEQEPADLRLHYEHATKMYDPPMGDGPEHGSPGRVLQEVVKMDNEVQILPDGDCEPEGEPGVTFECTSATVHPREFVNGPEEMYSIELTFADGTSQSFGEWGEVFEPPETFAGTGEHEGKVIEAIEFGNEPGSAAWFRYENPDADGCSPAPESGDADDADDATDDDADTTGDDTNDTTDTDGDVENGSDSDVENDSDAGAEDDADGGDDSTVDSGADGDATSSGDDAATDGGGDEGAVGGDGDDANGTDGIDDDFDWRSLFPW